MRQIKQGLRRLKIAVWITVALICLTSNIFPETILMENALWIVMATITVQSLLKVIQNLPVSATNRKFLRIIRFWITFGVILLLFGSLYLLNYWKHYGEYEVIGWPLIFYYFGGPGPYSGYSLPAFLIDVLLCFSIATASSLALRDGGRWLAVKIIKLLNNRM
jgi:hypothetical protein